MIANIEVNLKNIFHLMLEAEVFGESMILHPHKAMYWSREKTLLIADLHLGKINHFRRSGIAVPTAANDRNVELLVELFWAFKPERVLLLGDLFHSHYNPEWEVFGEVIRHFEAISFELVMGNHDIMSARQYERKGIRFYDELDMGPFRFTHHPMEDTKGRYNIAGHIHPGARLRGAGRQQVTLPCFYFGATNGLLPAFGMFTGFVRVKPEEHDSIYVIADEKVIKVS